MKLRLYCECERIDCWNHKGGNPCREVGRFSSTRPRMGREKDDLVLCKVCRENVPLRGKEKE